MILRKLIIISISLALVTLISCTKEESIEPMEPVDSLIDLQFSTSPIDLQGVNAQFAENIPYDQDIKNTFDIFLPASSVPTSLVIFIHGGGFTGGSKSFVYTSDFPEDIVQLLENNIAVATINYRLVEQNDTEGVLKSLNDSKRALQYIRYIHQELNIDKDKIVLYGTSAGASTALWLAANDDLKDENNLDQVLHESTRVSAIALKATQSSLDIENRWLNDVFVDFDPALDDVITAFGEETVFNFYGISSWEEYDSPELNEYRQQVDMLALLSPDDPEIWIENTGGQNGEPLTTSHWNHHPFHAREIKEYADAAGVANVAKYGNPVVFDDQNGESFVDFFLRKLDE